MLLLFWAIAVVPTLPMNNEKSNQSKVISLSIETSCFGFKDMMPMHREMAGLCDYEIALPR